MVRTNEQNNKPDLLGTIVLETVIKLIIKSATTKPSSLPRTSLILWEN